MVIDVVIHSADFIDLEVRLWKVRQQQTETRLRDADVFQIQASPVHLLDVPGESRDDPMLDSRNAQDAGIIGGEIARHIQLIVEARLLSLEPNAQREKAKVGGLGTVTLLRRENNPGTRNLAEPDGKPSKRQE